MFSMNISQLKEWQPEKREPVHLYVDARSTPPRVAAVLIKSVCIRVRILLTCFPRFMFVTGTDRSISAMTNRPKPSQTFSRDARTTKS